MRKKTKNRRKKDSKSSDGFMDKFRQYLLTLSFVICLLKKRDEISEKLRQLILAFFDFLSPCWTFLFIHKSEPNEKRKQIIETYIPNPFQDEPSDNGQTDSKSLGSKITTEFLPPIEPIVNSNKRVWQK